MCVRTDVSSDLQCSRLLIVERKPTHGILRTFAPHSNIPANYGDVFYGAPATKTGRAVQRSCVPTRDCDVDADGCIVYSDVTNTRLLCNAPVSSKRRDEPPQPCNPVSIHLRRSRKAAVHVVERTAGKLVLVR